MRFFLKTILYQQNKIFGHNIHQSLGDNQQLKQSHCTIVIFNGLRYSETLFINLELTNPG